MIRFEQVHKHIGGTQVLAGLSLHVPKGGVTGLLGPNGAGKTTCLRLAAGFFAPDQGRVLMDGREGVAQEPSMRTRIGYLPEQNPLYPEMTVRELVRLTGQIRGFQGAALRAQCAAVFARCDLEGVLTRKIGLLSKGFRQRVGLALALLGQPELLILDEPTTGLDPVQIEALGNLIHELGTQCTVVLSTHQLDQALALCRELMVLSRGQLVFSGTPKAFGEVLPTSVIKLNVRAPAATVQAKLQGTTGLAQIEAVGEAEPDAYRLTGSFTAEAIESLYTRLEGLPLRLLAPEPPSPAAHFAALLQRVV